MVAAEEFMCPTPAICLWQAYDPIIKSDLFSTAISTATGLHFVDPILLQEVSLERLVQIRRPVAVILTNANHSRAAAEYATKFSIPILTRQAGPKKVAPELNMFAIDGAADDEIALYFDDGGGTLIMGDALINFPPYGFTFLPAKYCNDEKRMRRSLRQLLELKFQRIFFAHGQPILTRAAERLRELLEA